MMHCLFSECFTAVFSIFDPIIFSCPAEPVGAPTSFAPPVEHTPAPEAEPTRVLDAATRAAFPGSGAAAVDDEGTETELAKKLGHVNLLKLGHHGSYGSNTDGYIRSLNPDMAILTGTYTYVTNTTINGECGTRDTLLAMGERGTPL